MEIIAFLLTYGTIIIVVYYIRIFTIILLYLTLLLRLILARKIRSMHYKFHIINDNTIKLKHILVPSKFEKSNFTNLMSYTGTLSKRN